MTARNPLPACLSHLAQRDAAVRLRALDDARQACIAISQSHKLSGKRCTSDVAKNLELYAEVTALDCVAAIRGLMEAGDG